MSVATTHLTSPAPWAAEPPRLARQLGYAGLIPFGLGAVLAWLVYPEAQPLVLRAVAAYGVCIVAFLGGLHWGLAMRAGHNEPAHFVWAVVPPLVASVAALMPENAGLVLIGVMLLVCYAVDRKLLAEQGLGAWLTLRFRLSALGSFCCFLAAASA
ncbi:DUF3429 domain-containing protein [Ideonella sp. DXS29W]|uniref:DUF3429 domain-containing protein n=1 Tax=Ideonella lacteola TaxID=2984193 RepID=A0ABU9BQ44_9BURK